MILQANAGKCNHSLGQGVACGLGYGLDDRWKAIGIGQTVPYEEDPHLGIGQLFVKVDRIAVAPRGEEQGQSQQAIEELSALIRSGFGELSEE